MAKLISEFIGVDPEIFEKTGAFDAILGSDSRFHIDPLLLQRTSAPELSESYERMARRFDEALRLLSASSSPADSFWKDAERRLDLSEPKGLAIGYSAVNDEGSGIGRVFRAKIMTVAKKVLEAGVMDPAIFELASILQPGVGSDRISDMIAGIIIEDLVAYSVRVYRELGAATDRVDYAGSSHQLVKNPETGIPLILLPRDILRPLPLAQSRDEIQAVCEYNQRLRNQVNAILGAAARKMTRRQKKDKLLTELLAEPELLREVLEAYAQGMPPEYDFQEDPIGEVVWYQASKRYVRENPLPLSLPLQAKPEEVLKVVLRICEQFKDLVENNDLSTLLYDGTRRNGFKPKHESAAQKVFYGIASGYCKQNNIEYTREPNAGRGPADLKFSLGYAAKVVVEIKLTTGDVKHGYQVQLPEYMKAEKAESGVFLLIDVLGGSPAKIRQVEDLVEEDKKTGRQVPSFILVDGRPKASASKYKRGL